VANGGKVLIEAIRGAYLGDLPAIVDRVIEDHRKVCKLTDDAYERIMNRLPLMLGQALDDEEIECSEDHKQ